MGSGSRTFGHAPFERIATANERRSQDKDTWEALVLTFAISSKHSESPGIGATPAAWPAIRSIAPSAGPNVARVSPNRIPSIIPVKEELGLDVDGCESRSEVGGMFITDGFSRRRNDSLHDGRFPDYEAHAAALGPL